VREPEKNDVASFPHGCHVRRIERLEYELTELGDARRGGDGLGELLPGPLAGGHVDKLEPGVPVEEPHELSASVAGRAHDPRAKALGPSGKVRLAVRQSAASSGTLRRGAPVALLCQILSDRSIIEGAIRPLKHLTVTEWTVPEWTESKNWTETYEAKRSASKNWTESTETYEAKRSASTEAREAKRSAQAKDSLQRSQQGERLAAFFSSAEVLAAASPHLLWPQSNWPIAT